MIDVYFIPIQGLSAAYFNVLKGWDGSYYAETNLALGGAQRLVFPGSDAYRVIIDGQEYRMNSPVVWPKQ